MKLYIAGPMSGLPHHNAPAFDAVAASLRALGFDVVSPPEITRDNPQPGIHDDGSIDPTTYARLVRLDLLALLDCDAVVVLDGWERSRGARLEAVIADRLGLRVYLASQAVNRGGECLHIEGIEQLCMTPIPALLPGVPFSVAQAGHQPCRVGGGE
jgi:hypothetical protein